jgi:hypothetical protein
MKKNLLSIALLLLAISAISQNVTKDDADKLREEAEKLKAMAADSLKPWKLGGIVTVNAQQVSLTNWAAGGNSSISLSGLINVFARYHKGKIVWDNNLQLGYGVIKQGSNKKWWKNDDKIQITSKLGREAAKHWYYSALVDFRTQFADGYNYPNDSVYISRFMAPGYGLASLGMDYKPSNHFSAYISPVTGKFTFVNDDKLASVGAFGVQKDIIDPTDSTKFIQRHKTHREEFGAYVKLQYQTKVMENITFQTIVELFSNYFHNPQNVDVNWTTLTTFKVNKFISATLSTQLIYDDDIKSVKLKATDPDKGPAVQFKQVLGVGFSYKF